MKRSGLKNIILLVAFLLCLPVGISAEIVTGYARQSARVALEIEWTADNYGTIQWQQSTDNGTTWSDIRNATSPVYEFTALADGLYRAKIETQDACEPVYIERQVKTMDFSIAVENITATTVDCKISNLNLNGAEVAEYGFCYNFSDLNTRNFRDMYRVQVDDPLPATANFTLVCEDLLPASSYSVRIYFKTKDGSLIFSPGRLVKTQAGLKWSAEDWKITKNSIAACFNIAGLESGAPNTNVVFKFGTSESNLQTVAVTNNGNYKYTSALIGSLAPNTTYFAQAEATIDGNTQKITKSVKTLSDYSSFVVDETTLGVKHTILWDATKTLHQISPVGLQTEYPRIIRVSPDTLICSYHGGTGSDYWVNVYIQKSYDNGRTWGDPITILDKEKSNLGSRYWRFTNPEMTKLKNGWIIMSVTANGNPETNNNCHVMVMLSKDKGETWGDPIIMGRGRTWEPMVLQLPNGELELYVSSEAAWWPGANGPQEILFSRSTDNGETWTELQRSSYSPDRRDGMPVAIVMQGNKGILYSIEIVNDGGFGSPSLVHRPLDGEWDSTPWNGVNTEKRWRVDLGAHGGAPHMIQLPTGEIVVTAHVNGRSVWQTSYPRVVVGDSNGKNFITPVTPIIGLPSNQGLYYNSLFLKDDETVWLVMTNSLYDGTTRKKGEIKYLEGKIIERK